MFIHSIKWTVNNPGPQLLKGHSVQAVTSESPHIVNIKAVANISNRIVHSKLYKNSLIKKLMFSKESGN